MANDWVVTLTFDVSPTDALFDTWLNTLDDIDASVARLPGYGIAVTTYVPGDVPMLEATMKAATETHRILDTAPIGVETLTEAAYAQRAEAPTMPELMSAAEIAEELDISRQRVHQLRTTAGFPAPLADLRGGAVWDAAAVRKFNREWTRKPGRPKNVDMVFAKGDTVMVAETKAIKHPRVSAGESRTVNRPASGQYPIVGPRGGRHTTTHDKRAAKK